MCHVPPRMAAIINISKRFSCPTLRTFQVLIMTRKLLLCPNLESSFVIPLLWRTTLKNSLTLLYSLSLSNIAVEIDYKPTALSRPGGRNIPVSVRAVVCLSSGLQPLLEAGQRAHRRASERVEKVKTSVLWYATIDWIYCVEEAASLHVRTDSSHASEVTNELDKQ